MTRPKCRLTSEPWRPGRSIPRSCGQAHRLFCQAVCLAESALWHASYHAANVTLSSPLQQKVGRCHFVLFSHLYLSAKQNLSRISSLLPSFRCMLSSISSSLALRHSRNQNSGGTGSKNSVYMYLHVFIYTRPLAQHSCPCHSVNCPVALQYFVGDAAKSNLYATISSGYHLLLSLFLCLWAFW